MIQVFFENNKILANVSDLKNWEENPRYIKEENFKQLSVDLENEEIKPMLILDDGTVLGGNMRLKAFKKQNKQKVWVSVITLKKDGEYVTAYVNGVEDKKKFESIDDAKLHYSTIDNSSYGANDPDKLAEMFYKSALPIENYLVTMENPKPISDLVKEISEKETQKVTKNKKITCPNCGHIWED